MRIVRVIGLVFVMLFILVVPTQAKEIAPVPVPGTNMEAVTKVVEKKLSKRQEMAKEKRIQLEKGAIIPELTVYANGVDIFIKEKEGTPYIAKDGKLMLPIKAVGEALGYSIKINDYYNPPIVIVGKGTSGFQFTLGNNIAYGDGSRENPMGEYPMSSAPILKDGIIYVDSKFFEEMVGLKVEYGTGNDSNMPKDLTRYAEPEILNRLKVIDKSKHKVYIYDEGMTKYINPRDIGDNYQINKADGSVIYFNTFRDIHSIYGNVKDIKSYEIVEAVMDTMVYKEYKDYTTMDFYVPLLPSDVLGFEIYMEFESVWQEWRLFYGTQYNDKFEQFRSDKINEETGEKEGDIYNLIMKKEHEYDFETNDIMSVNVRVGLNCYSKNNNPSSTGYYSSKTLFKDIKTGRTTIDNPNGEYMFEDNEIDTIEDFYLPQYRYNIETIKKNKKLKGFQTQAELDKMAEEFMKSREKKK